MKKNALGIWKISSRQFMILVILCFIGTSILLTPGGLAAEAKQDAWIAAIIGSLIGLPVVLFYNSIGSLFPNMSFIECIEKLLGKWLGKTVSILFVSFLFINCSTIVWFVGDFVTTQIMPETPIQFTNILIVGIVVIGTRLGLETFSRAGEIVFPWVIGLFIILALFASKDIKVQNIKPMFEYGVKPILRGALLYASYSSLTLIALMMIFPAYINNLGEAKKSFLIGTLIGGFMIFFVTILSIWVLGHGITARSTFPTYILAKKVRLGSFLQRIESVIAILWFISIFYKILIYFYSSVIGLAQILKLKDYKSLTLPLGMITVILSLVVYPNSTYSNIWVTTTWIPYVLSYSFFLPLLLLIVSIFRK